MEKLHRRTFLKQSSLAGFGLLTLGLPFTGIFGEERTFFLVTAHPDDDIQTLLRLANLPEKQNLTINRVPVQSTTQDLSVVEGKKVIDPRGHQRYQQFVSELRSRKSQAHTMVNIQSAPLQPARDIQFEVDGQTVELIDPTSEYKRIVIPGVDDDMVFSLHNRRLSVEEPGCRHEICKKMGDITSGRILCAPNRVMASIPGDRGFYDTVTG